MKKLLCLILALSLLGMVAGCGKKTKPDPRPTVKTDASKVDIVRFVKKGTMPESKYSLGDSFEKINRELIDTEDVSETEDNGENDTFIDDSDEKLKTVFNGDFHYVFNKEDEDSGLAYIVSLGQSFGFKQSIDPNTVTAVMKDKGHTASLSPISKLKNAELYKSLIFGSDDCDCLEYTFSGKTLVFIFENNLLTATILYKG